MHSYTTLIHYALIHYALIHYADLKKRIAGDTEPLYLAAQRGYGEVCRELLLAGADVNFEMPLGSFNKHVTLKGGGEGTGAHYAQKNTGMRSYE
jgi:hypothetical protein